MDRPALAVEVLDPRAWAALRWRQEHLPLARLRRRSRFLNFTYGWGAWFKNRQGGLGYRWFRLHAAPYYRGAPQL